VKRYRLLEAITTKYLVLTVLVIIAITVGGFALVLAYGLTDIDTLATFVDAVFKTVALLVGAIWALNRYFAQRTDVTQIRVDSDVDIIRNNEFGGDSSDLALLVYRLDVVNTGSTLIPDYNQFLEIDAVSPSKEGTRYECLYRWPSIGLHAGGPIEPGSWAAINDAIPVPADVRAVRLYLEIQLSKDNIWTWHKTFDVFKGKSNE